MSRYDVDKFVPPPDQELLCCICTNVLDEPVESPCRHVFCKLCIETWLNNKSNCPTCRYRVTGFDLKPVLPLVRNMLNKLTLMCDFTENGCKDLVPLEKYQNHIKACDYERVVCRYPKCAKSMLRKMIKYHEEEECLCREVMCTKNCGLRIQIEEIDNHDCLKALKAFCKEKDRETEKLKGELAELRKSFAELKEQFKTYKKEAARRRRESWETTSSLHSGYHSGTRNIYSESGDSNSRSRSRSRSPSRSVSRSISRSRSRSHSPIGSRSSSLSRSPLRNISGSYSRSSRSISRSPRRYRHSSDSSVTSFSVSRRERDEQEAILNSLVNEPLVIVNTDNNLNGDPEIDVNDPYVLRICERCDQSQRFCQCDSNDSENGSHHSDNSEDVRHVRLSSPTENYQNDTNSSNSENSDFDLQIGNRSFDSAPSLISSDSNPHSQDSSPIRNDENSCESNVDYSEIESLESESSSSTPRQNDSSSSEYIPTPLSADRRRELRDLALAGRPSPSYYSPSRIEADIRKREAAYYNMGSDSDTPINSSVNYSPSHPSEVSRDSSLTEPSTSSYYASVTPTQEQSTSRAENHQLTNNSIISVSDSLKKYLRPRCRSSSPLNPSPILKDKQRRNSDSPSRSSNIVSSRISMPTLIKVVTVPKQYYVAPCNSPNNQISDPSSSTLLKTEMSSFSPTAISELEKRLKTDDIDTVPSPSSSELQYLSENKSNNNFTITSQSGGGSKLVVGGNIVNTSNCDTSSVRKRHLSSDNNSSDSTEDKSKKRNFGKRKKCNKKRTVPISSDSEDEQRNRRFSKRLCSTNTAQSCSNPEINCVTPPEPILKDASNLKLSNNSLGSPDTSNDETKLELQEELLELREELSPHSRQSSKSSDSDN